MTIGQELFQELELEAAVARNYLAAVPFDQLDFQPAEKSEKLGRLAVHLAEILAWWPSCIRDKRLDFKDFQPKEFATNQDLLSYFDSLLADAKAALLEVDDEVFKDFWAMTHGDDVLFELSKKQVMRIFCMNHLVHHRAQLGVYLRMLGVAVPATYGPSADDENVILIQPFEC
ncbi:MAG: DinB family protein [Chitinophagales bacterium]